MATKKKNLKKAAASRASTKKSMKKTTAKKKPAVKQRTQKTTVKSKMKKPTKSSGKTSAKAPAQKKSAPVKKKSTSTPVKAAAPKKAPVKASVSSVVKKKSTKTPVVRRASGEDQVKGVVDFVPYETKQSEEYMNDSQREHFRLILNQWKSQLMQEVDSTVNHMKEEVASFADPLDRAQQEEGFSLELRTRDRERKLLKKIGQSLEALKNGEYGYCEDCGAEIGLRRLEARPTADKCIDCKTFEEIKEKQTG